MSITPKLFWKVSHFLSYPQWLTVYNVISLPLQQPYYFVRIIIILPNSYFPSQKPVNCQVVVFSMNCRLCISKGISSVCLALIRNVMEVLLRNQLMLRPFGFGSYEGVGFWNFLYSCITMKCRTLILNQVWPNFFWLKVGFQSRCSYYLDCKLVVDYDKISFILFNCRLITVSIYIGSVPCRLNWFDNLMEMKRGNYVSALAKFVNIYKYPDILNGWF